MDLLTKLTVEKQTPVNGIMLFNDFADDHLNQLETLMSTKQAFSINKLATGFISLSTDGLNQLASLIGKNLQKHASQEHLTEITKNQIATHDLLSTPNWDAYFDHIARGDFKRVNIICKKLLSDGYTHFDMGTLLLNKLFDENETSLDTKINLLQILSKNKHLSPEIYANAGHWAFYSTGIPDHFTIAQKLYKRALTGTDKLSKKFFQQEKQPREYYLWRNYLLCQRLNYIDKRYLLTLAHQWRKIIALNEADPLGWELGGDIYLCLNECENSTNYQESAAQFYQKALSALNNYPKIEFNSPWPILCWSIVAYQHHPQNLHEKLAYVQKKQLSYGVIIHKTDNRVSLNLTKPDPNNDFPAAGGCSGCGCGCSSANNSNNHTNKTFYQARQLIALLKIV